VTAGSDGPHVAIAASGPLPAPQVGVLEHPARIYLDFAGVAAGTSGSRAADGVVAGVRVAVHSVTPLVTRVVIDLHRAVSHTVDLSGLQAGKVDVRFSAAGQTTSAGSPIHATPPTPSAQAAAPRRVAKLDDPASRVLAALARLDSVRGVLELIDRRSPQPHAAIDEAVAALQRTREDLALVHPPKPLAAGHASARGACTLAERAVALASKATGDVPWDAASAAAGALILLDRAHNELASSAKH
jgi:hypothetical protein